MSSERSHVATDDEWPDRPGDLALVFIPDGRTGNVAETLMDGKFKGPVWSRLGPNSYLSELREAIRQRDENAGGRGPSS